MKTSTIKKILFVYMALCSIQLFAQESKNGSLLSMSLTTDFAYYPKTEQKNGGNHFSGNDYGIFDDSYDGDFVTHSINPILQLNFGKKNELLCLFCFSTRWSFDIERDKIEDELFMRTTGSEWYFKRIALAGRTDFRKKI